MNVLSASGPKAWMSGVDATATVTMLTSSSAPSAFHATISARGATPRAARPATISAVTPVTMSKLRPVNDICTGITPAFAASCITSSSGRRKP